MNDFNSADTFNQMFRDSENNGYKTSYTRVKNNSYGKSQNNSKGSNAKVLTYIFVGGVILYYTYKNILKPAAKVINKIIDVFDEDDEKPNVRSYAKHDERIFSGQVKRLSEREARKLKRSSLTAYEDPNRSDHYVVDYY